MLIDKNGIKFESELESMKADVLTAYATKFKVCKIRKDNFNTFFAINPAECDYILRLIESDVNRLQSVINPKHTPDGSFDRPERKEEELRKDGD